MSNPWYVRDPVSREKHADIWPDIMGANTYELNYDSYRLLGVYSLPAKKTMPFGQALRSGLHSEGGRYQRIFRHDHARVLSWGDVPIWTEIGRERFREIVEVI